MITAAAQEREHYLNASYGIKSWLLTKDHKRIGLLYLATITLFFFLGGAFATLIRIELLTPRNMLYVSTLGRYVPESEVPPNADVLDMSETQLNTLLAEGRPIPEWFTPPAVAEELRRTHRPRSPYSGR